MTSRGFVLRRGVPAALLLLHLALLGSIVATWWAHRENHLFAEGRWIAGKDTGKFVFYTYELLFHPLDASGVDLSRHMGFQEILHREPEAPDRRLRRLAFETQVADGGYLWIELRTRGPRRLAFRLSRSSRYPGGTYELSERGERTRFEPFAQKPFVRGTGWRRVELRHADGRWALDVDGERLDTVDDAPWKDGRFGFRGSGPLASPVRVRDVRMTFDDGRGATWTERSQWLPSPRRQTVLAAFAFAALVLVLRALHRDVFARALPEERRRGFLAIGDFALTGLLLAGWATAVPSSGLAFPAGLLALELLDLVALAWLQRTGAPGSLAIPRRLAAAAAASTVAVAGLALVRHGEFLGRALPHGPPALASVHPAAYRLVPEHAAPSGPFELREPVTVAPGEPFFIAAHAWREQAVTASLILSPGMTLDLVLEQRSFGTHGDPRGEELPHSRRLVRLTTRDDVPSGLAVGTGNRPGLFRTIEGQVVPNEPTELEVRTDGSSMTVRLNGAETVRRGVPSLGFGETGFLAYDGEAEVRRLRIASLHPSPVLASWRMLLPPVLLGALVWAFLGRRTTGSGAVALQSAAFFPLAAYAAAALVIPAAAWGLLGRDRFAWLDLCLGATFLTHVALLVISRRRDTRAIVLFNALALGFVAAGALLVWDRLPEAHPIRLRFAGAALAPGETVAPAPGGAPWYADDRSIGANTWVWKQRPGGETITREKTPGIVRIVVVGGSQAWGSGAASSSETFAELLEGHLREAGLPVEVFNGGINGAGVSRIALAWEGLWRQLAPDVVVADVGLNDSSALRQIRDRKRWGPRIRALAADFERMLRLCRADGVDVVLVQEPIATEAPLRPVRRLYAALETTALRHAMTVVDPRPAIRKRERDHLVWWDTAHLAPYGHSLMAETIAPEVARVVRARLASRAGPAPNT